MIVEIDDKLVSSEIIENQFVCDLNACKGACCVKGDAGAPVSFSEISILEEEIENIKPFLTPEGVEAIEKSGVFYIDTTKDKVTTLMENGACAFVVFDEKGIAKCGVEMAHKAGKSSIVKPISCHLYPIRVSKKGKYTFLNYDRWDICNPACKLGETLKVKTYRFLKEPITKAFGKQFYEELALVDEEIEKMNAEK